MPQASKGRHYPHRSLRPSRGGAESTQLIELLAGRVIRPYDPNDYLRTDEILNLGNDHFKILNLGLPEGCNLIGLICLNDPFPRRPSRSGARKDLCLKSRG
jgi:hypothetical protein